MITFDELKQAAKVFDRINDIRNYVTKEQPLTPVDGLAKILDEIDKNTNL